MKTQPLASQAVDLERLVRAQASSHDLPLWMRVALWAWGHTDQHGHARAYAGQLRTDLSVTTAPEISKAIGGARDRGLLDPCSTASCLVLPGHAVAPCDANHRGER